MKTQYILFYIGVIGVVALLLVSPYDTADNLSNFIAGKLTGGGGPVFNPFIVDDETIWGKQFEESNPVQVDEPTKTHQTYTHR